MTIDLIEVITEAANRQDTQDAVANYCCDDTLFDDEERKEMFCDGSFWNEYVVDEQLSDDAWKDYFISLDGTHSVGFNVDICGDSDDDLVKKLVKNPLEAEKCLLHSFELPSELGDDLKMLIVTTADREKLVGWTLIED